MSQETELRVHDDLPAYIYRWIAGIPNHMHVISGGVDMHLAETDSRVFQESTAAPDPDNGFQGYVYTREELPTREPVAGLFATSVMSPYDEFHVRDINGTYIGRLNRSREGFYTVSVKDRATETCNQPFKTIPDALEYISGVLTGEISGTEKKE